MRSAYDEILLAHNLHPAHRGELIGATRNDLINASCGDEISVFLQVKNGKITDAKWEGKGCAIALASADLMCEILIGKKMTEARGLGQNLLKLLRGELDAGRMELLGEAAALSTVARMPARVACAKLAWQMLEL